MVALVTGGGRVIGQGIALRLAKEVGLAARNTRLPRRVLGILFLGMFGWTPPNLALQSGTVPARHAVANEAVEWSYISRKTYADAFNDVEVNVIFKASDGERWNVPAFWTGGSEWKVRFAAPRPGTYRYHCESTDRANPDLNGHEGVLQVEPYQGANSLLIHGFPRVSANRRYFEYADGTPFFWLGDTWWKGLCRRLTFDNIKALAADRRAKGFTVVQIVAGLNPDEPPFDPGGYNEGGFAWEPGFARINPRYFDYADRRIQWMVKSELTPAMVACWGYYLPWMGVDKMKQHWRYLVARYGAYPTIWILAGEGIMPYYESRHRERDRELQKTGWPELARYLKQIDPYHHPITMHPNTSGREQLGEGLLDFDMLQTGHGGWTNTPRQVGQVSAGYSKTPPMPVVVGEAVYEAHRGANFEDIERYTFWTTILNGGAGFTYGAGGIWQANGIGEPQGPSPSGVTYETTPWNEAMKLPGSRQVGVGKAILARFPWWRFEPHPEWVEPHGTAFLEPHAQWFDTRQRWAAENGDSRLPYAAGIPGQMRVIYIPSRLTYDASGPLVMGLEAGVPYRASYINPVDGNKINLGSVVRPASSEIFADREGSADGPHWEALGPAAKAASRWSVVRGVRESDVMVSVEAQSTVEAGILLRARDAGNCVVAVYSPLAKGIWLHDRRKGEYGLRLGFVDVPAITGNVRLVAEVHGSAASLTLSDTKRIYRTLPVKVSSVAAGGVGLWSEALECESGRTSACSTDDKAGSRQSTASYNDFRVQRVEEIPPEANGNLIVLNTWRAPLVPTLQDWVLLLER